MNQTHRAIPDNRSALAFNSVWTREAIFIDTAEEYQPASAIDICRDVTVRLEVTVKLADLGRRAFVRLRAQVDPPAAVAAFSKLSAAVEGVFSLFDGDDQSKLNAFARGQAPVLLLPYLRAVISSITAQSRMGAIVLPPINMVQIIERMQSSTEIEQATR